MNEKEKINLIHWTKHWRPYKKVFGDEIPDSIYDAEDSVKDYVSEQDKERNEWLEWRKRLGYPEKYES